MKHILSLALFLLFAATMQAQSEAPVVVSLKKHKVVFQLTSNDTLVHKSLIKQLHNFLNAAPNAHLEVVCHNNGISFLQQDVTKQGDKIRELKAKGVDFVACENTMRERKIKRESLVAECRTVPSGLVEIVMKQEKGWSYIKAGF
ncbi:MAG TPA: DsrE family protein [Saprospiraceae bacterium]|nr:DsrE family protein [Saprospiraceae bacterium]HNL38548.1 DsrE family protein [Saprospiraceae bacterium]HNM26231.1 DsrE family protein [Saprospiraceae bacterium]